MADAKNTPKITSLGDACCGCGACAARCPKGCISMGPDAWGFLHPVVDVSACVGCGACDAACPVMNLPDGDGCESVLWVKANDADLLDRSSSGGAFGLLAKDALLRGGAVAGAAWADGCRELRHVLVENESSLDAVMRSKYVQGSVGREVYEGVRDVLRAGRPALFSGTACQVAAMRSYLGKLADSDSFLGIDVICHGTPSPGLWRHWLDYVEDRERGEVLNVNFRSKATGWVTFSVAYECSATGEGGAAHVSSSPFGSDWYMRAFLQNASLRPSCLACSFKRRCGSDVTIGDYWGIQGQHPEVPIEGGVSAVVCSTGKGKDAIRRISDSVDSGKSSFDKVVAGNVALVRSVQPYPKRQLFMADLADGVPIPDMMARWDFEPTLGQRLASKAKGAVKRLLGRV